MYLGLLLDMSYSGFPDRAAITVRGDTITFGELAERSWAAASRLIEMEAPSVIFLGSNHVSYAVALFGAAGAGVPFIPLNYRLGEDQLEAQIKAHPGAFILYEGLHTFLPDAALMSERGAFFDSLASSDVGPPPSPDAELPGVLLYTSGTTAAPKAAVLRHRHLMAYLFGTVEFASAEPDEVALVSVPPYHIAGVANLLSNMYAGRHIIYLDRFDPDLWLSTVREHEITQAMVVPTMLAQIVERLSGAANRSRTVALGCPLRFSNELSSCSRPLDLSMPTVSPKRVRPSLCWGPKSTGQPSPRTTLWHGNVWDRWESCCLESSLKFELKTAPCSIPVNRGFSTCEVSRYLGSTPASSWSTTRVGSRPAIEGGSMTRATSSLRAGPMTRLFGEERTSLQLKSRTFSSPTTGSSMPWWSGCPTKSGANAWLPSSSWPRTAL